MKKKKISFRLIFLVRQFFSLQSKKKGKTFISNDKRQSPDAPARGVAHLCDGVDVGGGVGDAPPADFGGGEGCDYINSSEDNDDDDDNIINDDSITILAPTFRVVFVVVLVVALLRQLPRRRGRTRSSCRHSLAHRRHARTRELFAFFLIVFFSLSLSCNLSCFFFFFFPLLSLFLNPLYLSFPSSPPTNTPHKKTSHQQQMKSFEAAGLTRAQAEELTTTLTQVLCLNREKISEGFVAKAQLERTVLEQDARVAALRSEVTKGQELHLASLARDTERLTASLDRVRAEIRAEADKLTAATRLDLNLEKGRMRDEIQALRDKAAELEIKVDKETSALKGEGGLFCDLGESEGRRRKRRRFFLFNFFFIFFALKKNSPHPLLSNSFYFKKKQQCSSPRNPRWSGIRSVFCCRRRRSGRRSSGCFRRNENGKKKKKLL